MSGELLTRIDISPEELMKGIANDSLSNSELVNYANPIITNNSENQIKLFLLAQAKRELKRVVALTDFMDKVELNYINKVNSEMDNDNLDLKEYSGIINTITSLINRSANIIQSVIKDDSITKLIFIDNSTTNINSVGTVINDMNLTDPGSRERVRRVVDELSHVIEIASSGEVIDSDI